MPHAPIAGRVSVHLVGQEPVGGRAPFAEGKAAPGAGLHVIAELGLVGGVQGSLGEGCVHSCADDLVGPTSDSAHCALSVYNTLFLCELHQRGEEGNNILQILPTWRPGHSWAPPPGPSTWRIPDGGVREPENGGPSDSLQRWSVARGPAPSRALDQAGRGSHTHTSPAPSPPQICIWPWSGRGPPPAHRPEGAELGAPGVGAPGSSGSCHGPGGHRGHRGGLPPDTQPELRRVLHPPRPPPEPPPGGGAQSSVFVESFPAGWTPSHLAERLLRFVLGKSKHQLTPLASLERAGVTRKWFILTPVLVS